MEFEALFGFDKSFQIVVPVYVLIFLSGLYYFIVVVLVSPFKSYIQIVVWYSKGLFWTFFSVHACVILDDICYFGVHTSFIASDFCNMRDHTCNICVFTGGTSGTTGVTTSWDRPWPWDKADKPRIIQEI